MLHSEPSTELVQFMWTVWRQRDFKMVLVWRISFGWSCFLSPSLVLYKEPDRVGMSEYPTLSSDNFWVLREGVWRGKNMYRKFGKTVHSPVSGNLWLDDNSGKEKCFSVVILEVIYVFAVSKIGVTLFHCSLWFHSLSHQEITLWCCSLSTWDMLLRIKQTSEVMARNRLFPSVRFNIEISAKLTVLTYVH